MKKPETKPLKASGKQQPDPSPAAALERRTQKVQDMRQIGSFVGHLLLVLVIGWAALRYVFSPLTISGADMAPALENGDLVLVSRMISTPKSGSIISYTKDGQTYTGRVAAAGGDKIEISEDGKVLVNDCLMAFQPETPQLTATSAIQLKSNEYYVLSDDRSSVHDGRTFGPIQSDQVQGEVISVLRTSNL